MNNDRIIQQGDIAKFKIVIQHEDFDQERDDYRVELQFGMLGGMVTVAKDGMVHDEEGNTFLMFDTSAMTGWVKAYCIYYVPDTDFPSGIRREIDIQYLCFVANSDNARLCCGDKQIVTVGHVVYERVYRGDVNTLFLNLRDCDQEQLVDADGKHLRVRKTDEVEKGNFACFDANGFVVDSGFKPDDFVQSSTIDGYATKAWVESQGYLGGDALDGYATEAWVESKGYITSVPVTSVNGQTGDVVIETAAVQSDWNQTDDSQLDYIKNKPTIPTVPTNVSAFTNDAGYLTQHQSLSNYVEKSQTAGLLKNDGTVDTNTYITQHQDISGKEDKVAIDSTAKTASFSASVGNYYKVNIAASVSVTITLTTPTDSTKLSSCIFFVTTSTSPSLTFSAASGISIYKSTSYSIEASKVYEINAMWNGSAWLIASVEMEVQS